MFGIGGFELVLILLFGFLLFGPEKLPEIARMIGKGIAKFRAAQQDMSEVLKDSNAFDPDSDEPFKDPTETIEKLTSTAEKHVRSAVSEGSTAVKNKTHEGVESSSAAKRETASKPKPAAKPQASSVKNESFTERKARYERERAAKLEAEKAAAEAAEAAQTAEAATNDTPATAEGGEQ